MALSPNSSTLLFAHPSARLTKTVPPVHPPIRANGAVPLDALGLGNPASQRDVLLADTYGPLALNVVPHPFLPLPASLVLSIGSAPDAQAAARTHVLPFRAIHTRSSSSQAATPRTTYDGLGAGLHGTEGGSFWFFEHVDEEGAADRARWEHQGVGRRAIWTVWLLSAPAPLVTHLRALLTLYPAPTPALPPFLQDPASYPWNDNDPYISIPAKVAAAVEEARSVVVLLDTPPAAPISPTSPTRRPLPPVPNRKPNKFRMGNANPASQTTERLEGLPKTSATLEALLLPAQESKHELELLADRDRQARPSDTPNAHPVFQPLKPDPIRNLSDETPATPPSASLIAEELDHNDSIKESKDDVNAGIGIGMAPVSSPSSALPALAHLIPAACAEQEQDALAPSSASAPQPASEEEPEPEPEPEPASEQNTPRPSRLLPGVGTMRSIRGMRPPSEYRHSLVAVDNETGEIVGVIAEGVRLDEDEDPDAGDTDDEPEHEQAGATTSPCSSDDPEPEILTPLDGQPFPSAFAFTGHAKDASSGATILKPIEVYRDADHAREPSRAESRLGEDTFAPPPLPAKNVGTGVGATPSARTSVASALFFSAAEDGQDEEHEGHEEGEDEQARERLAGFTSLDHAQHAGRIEASRPDLLRDPRRGDGQDEDEDKGAQSDASGSTIGGPAVKWWRKARGKKGGRSTKGPEREREEEEAVVTYGNVKPNQPQAPAQAQAQRRQRTQVSEMSVRTSRAETAIEGESDTEEHVEEVEAGTSPSDALEAVVPPLESTPEDADAVDAPPTPTQHARDSTSASTTATRLHGHRPRAVNTTEAIRSIEDGVWAEALESGELPVDAPYTHLAARGLAGARARAGTQSESNNETFELLGPGEVTRRSGGGAQADQNNVQLEMQMQKSKDGKKRKGNLGGPAMQGGTVLLEFLAGSRIRASTIRRGFTGDGNGGANEGNAGARQGKDGAAGVGEGVMSLIPAMPVHFLWFLDPKNYLLPSSTTSTSPSGSNSNSDSASGEARSNDSAAPATIPEAFMSSGVFIASVGSAVWEGFSGLGSSAAGMLGSAWAGFSLPLPLSSSSSVDTSNSGSASAERANGEGPDGKKEGDAGRDEEAEGWEYAIPEFDPNSLASTPRPVYRRKRPSPSLRNGFVTGPSSAASPSSNPSHPSSTTSAQPSTQASEPKSPSPSPSSNSNSNSSPSPMRKEQRYSIVHFDGSGVGRRALLRGPGAELDFPGFLPGPV